MSVCVYLVYCTCACNHALHVSSIESVQVMAPSMVAIRWCGNGSPRYDGRVNQVLLKTIFADDVAAGLEVGKLVRVKWGGGGELPSKVQHTCTLVGLEMVSCLVSIPVIISQPAYLHVFTWKVVQDRQICIYAFAYVHAPVPYLQTPSAEEAQPPVAQALPGSTAS